MRVGVDIGGTFTDVVVFDEQQGSVQLAKALSTPRELARGVRDAPDAWVILRFLAGRPGDGEGLEGGGRGVTRAARRFSQLRAGSPRPEFMDARMQNTKEIVVVAGNNVHGLIDDCVLVDPNKQAMFRDQWGADKTAFANEGFL